MPSQRPYFLSSFIAAFRQQAPSLQTSAQQANKHAPSASSGPSSAAAASSSSSAAASAAYHHHHHHHHHQQKVASTPPPSASRSPATDAGVAAYHSARGPSATGGINIPGASSPTHRRGSDSSSEGFRDVLGTDKWYIGGRTAAGEEKFFKLGVVRRVKSNDGLSLDRLSL